MICTDELPLAVGVPVITPVAALIVRPAGSPVADHDALPATSLAVMVVGGYG